MTAQLMDNAVVMPVRSSNLWRNLEEIVETMQCMPSLSEGGQVVLDALADVKNTYQKIGIQKGDMSPFFTMDVAVQSLDDNMHISGLRIRLHTNPDHLIEFTQNCIMFDGIPFAPADDSLVALMVAQLEP